MEEKHKKLIQKNFVELVHRTNLDKLLPILITKGVYSDRIVEPFQNNNKSLLDRKRELFDSIQRRGPLAFDKLVAALREVNDDHNVLANLLEGKEVVFPQKSETTIFNNNYHNINNGESVIDECTISNFIPSSSGANPYKLAHNQRPLHIRQLSEESPYANIYLTDEPLVVNVKKAEQFFDCPKHSKLPIYRTRSQLRGIYLGINNVRFINNIHAYRAGAEVDEKNLKDLFTQMQFECHTYRDQTMYDMEHVIKEFTNSETNPSLKRADCLFIAIMSHGEEGESQESSEIITADGRRLPVSVILRQFNNLNCPEFQNKPKIFMFQICRGNNYHYGAPMHRRIRTDSINKTPGGILREMTDMLIAFSTLPGDKSYRDTLLGTWYIQIVCDVFMKHAYDTDVEGLLKMVDEKLKNIQSEDGNMQTSSYECRAFKVCYLHPGLYE